MHQKMSLIRPILIAATVSVTTLGSASVVLAEGHRKGGEHEQRHAAMQGQYGPQNHKRGRGMHRGQGGGKHSKGKHGQHSGGKHGKHGHHLFGNPWKKTLTDDQKAKLDQLHAAHARHIMPMKARMKAIKIELATLATAETPDTQAMQRRINELLEVKREILTQKYLYIAAKRSVLSPAQRPSFDLNVIHESSHAKTHKGGH